MNKNLNRHLEKVFEKFPKLKFEKHIKSQTYVLRGDLDICDPCGQYWDTFNILIAIPSNYPYSIPRVFEKSNKIPRVEDRHISEDGECCLDMDHELLLDARDGMDLCSFINNYVYPYFANQIYYDRSLEKKYANGEWEHRFDGVVQYYENQLGLTDYNIIVKALPDLIRRKLPSRNSKCFCSEKKFKFCEHRKSFEKLSKLPSNRLKHDLEGFNALVA